MMKTGGKRLLIQPELLRPQAIPFAAGFLSVDFFKTILDHLIHFREPDPKNLGQDFLSHLEFQLRWIHPRSAIHHDPLLWPD